MGTAKPKYRVYRFVSLIFRDHSVCTNTRDALVEEFGPEKDASTIRSWDYSPLYKTEMGSGLKWILVGYHRRDWAEDLWQWKAFTNSLERDFSHKDGSRSINIDPGYIEANKVVLASTKNYSNRVYLREGIYADLTLFFDYKKDEYVPHALSFPEYRTDFARSWFLLQREQFKKNRPTLESGDK